jgi:hypothetical protein
LVAEKPEGTVGLAWHGWKMTASVVLLAGWGLRDGFMVLALMLSCKKVLPSVNREAAKQKFNNRIANAFLFWQILPYQLN